MKPEVYTTIVIVGALLFLASLAAAIFGCASGGAEAAYTGALVRCVERSATLAESKACRREVDRQWGLDAGGDQ